MINPKQGLHSFARIYQAKNTPPNARAKVFGNFAAQLADSDAVHETDAMMLQNAQEQYSINTIEEMAALARMDARKGTAFLKNIGLAPDMQTRILGLLDKVPEGKEILQEIERYEKLNYSFGCDLDFSSPPPDENFLRPAQAGGVTFGAAPPGAVPPGSVPGGAGLAAPTAGVNLIDGYMPPIRDQANRGTCVAFTCVACLEYYMARFRGQSVDLSEQFQFWNMVTSTGQRNLVSGFPLLKNSGVCREQTWPYYGNVIPPNDDQGPPPAPALAEAPAFRSRDVRQISARSVSAIQDELRQARLVGIGIPVYQSWFNSGIVRQRGNITVPLPGEVPMPIGHAITLVGFMDDPDFAGGGYFIVRNSWDHYWATLSVLGSGYGTIPYRYISNFNWDAWSIIA